MLPLQIGEIALACKGEAHGEAQVTSVCIDSRKISQGCLFIAIKGDRFDGHDFVEKAFEEGAAAVMVHRDIHCRGPYVRVANTREALLRLAGYYRQFFQIPVVGLTGSVGKTTTKEMTAAVLSKRYKTLKNEGNLNNEIGMPMTAFGLDLGYGAAVFEMGMSGFGEIARMARAAAPTVGIITNIGVSHMEQLGSRENIRKAKLELLDGMDEYAPLILNGDDALLAGAQIKGRPVFYYGIEEERCRIRAQKITQSDRELSFTINYGYGSFSVQMPVVGMHFVYDALAAFTAGLILGIAPQAAAQALGEYEPAGMRQRVRQANGVTILEDCYNASPDSMRAAIRALRMLDAKRHIAVLGDMLELGSLSGQAHAQIGAFAAQEGVALLFACGPESARMAQAANEAGIAQCFYAADKNGLLEELLRTLQPGDAVLFKASRGMRFEELIEAIYEGWKIK